MFSDDRSNRAFLQLASDCLNCEHCRLGGNARIQSKEVTYYYVIPHRLVHSTYKLLEAGDDV